MAVYAADTWLPEIVIDSTNNVFVVTEDPGGAPNVVTVTVDACTCFMHDDGSFQSTKKGLLYILKTLLNTGTVSGLGSVSGTASNTYEWNVVTPGNSTGLTNNGLELRAASAAADFEITWTGATTMDGHWFGESAASPGSDTASATDGSDEVIIFDEATKYRMVTRDILDGAATDKRKHHYKDVRFSSSRPSDSVGVVWDEGAFRIVTYEDVPGVEVHQTRADESEWAATTGRATGDTQATWYWVYDVLATGGECIIVHNSSSDLQVDANSYETVKAAAPIDWDSAFSQQNRPGDYYTINLTLWIDPDASNYGH
jgi:hypothetical protein